MKKLIFLFASLFAIILSMNLVPAPGPNFHLENIDIIRLDPKFNGTVIGQIINNNYDACLVGLAYPDVGIFEYYTNFKAYKSLHNYNLVSEMLRLAKNDRERAFAYCWKAHLGVDGMSHHFLVPVAIKRTKLPNEIIHAPTELRLDSKRIDPRANRLMEKHREFDALVEKASGRDWSGEADKLNTILGGADFYSEAYLPDSSTTFGKIQRGFYKFVEIFVADTADDEIFELSITAVEGIFMGETSSLDPSGELALKNADLETRIWLYVGSFVIILGIFILSFWKNWIGFKKGR